MKRKKVNPNRIPVSKADLAKAKREAVDESVMIAWSIMFTVLQDKEGFDSEALHRVWNEINELSESIEKGYVTITDLRHILKEESGAVML